MNLDKIQINACLRSGMQSLDLGFLMANAWWRSLYFAGAVPALICFIPLLIYFFDDPFWAGFIVWWLKPFWERMPLYVASRRLFQDEPTYAEIVGRTRRLLLFDMLPQLLWRRLSLQRAFDAPVTVLEELKGSDRSRRLKVLHGRYTDVALGNQFICFCFEIIVMLGLIILALFFIPDSMAMELFDSFESMTLTAQWTWIVFGFVAMTLMMPFHTMAGFALYLNRRIELEAWDIEINFRNLANRKRQATTGVAAAMMAFLLSAVLVFTPPADAAISHDRESASALIKEILDGDDFGKEEMVEVWRFGSCEAEELEEEEDEPIPDWLIDFFDWDLDLSGTASLLKILLVLGFAALVMYLVYRYRGPLGFAGRIPRKEEAPEVLFGLDVRPESLPSDVPTEVLAIWRDGQYREALSLLYRASLSRLIDRYEMAFRASHTEAECASLVAEQGIESLSRYFTDLTNVWRRLAYGHQVPPEETVQALCAGWSKEMTDEPV